MAGLEQGEVSLGAASIYWLPDMLHSFQVLHPSIHFRLSQCSLAEMPQRLETGACDFCFLSTPLVKPGIRWEALRTEEILLVVPPMHRLAGQEIVPLSEVAHESVVIEKVGSGLRDLMDTCCQQAGFTLHPSYEIDEPAAPFAFVKAQLGVGFTTALMEKRAHEHTLPSLHLTNPTCQRPFGIGWHQKHYLSQAAQAFYQFVREYCAHLEQDVSPSYLSRASE